jgi:hypothetical protein
VPFELTCPCASCRRRLIFLIGAPGDNLERIILQRQILRRVALLRRRPRTRRLNHIQNLGDGQSLRPLVLHHAVGSRMTGLKGDALGFAAKELSRRFGSGYSEQTNHTIWRKYKKVSHYWAAYISISSGLSSNTAPSCFPCTVDQLPGFLAAAEYFCAVGAKNEVMEVPQTHSTHSRSVRPDTISDPASNVSWPSPNFLLF